MMLYSTCTFDEEENEVTIRRLLKEHDDLHLIATGKTGWLSARNRTFRVRQALSHKIRGEGHFIALLKRMDAVAVPEEDGGRSRESAGAFGRPAKWTKEWEPVREFLALTHREWEPGRLYHVNETIYYLPEPSLWCRSALS